MPDVSRETLIALGGSNTLYLGTKAFAFFSRRVVAGENGRE
jgi:hypothetical protein